MSQGSEFSMMSRLVGNRVLKMPVFSVFLSDSDDEESEVTFGDVKEDHMSSKLFWVPVVGLSGYWEVQMQDITLNKRPLKLCRDCRAAVDTGTSMLAGPSRLIHYLRDVID